MGGILFSMRGGKAVEGICAGTKLAVLVCFCRTVCLLPVMQRWVSRSVQYSGVCNMVVQDLHHTHLHAQGCCATNLGMHAGCSFKSC